MIPSHSYWIFLDGRYIVLLSAVAFLCLPLLSGWLPLQKGSFAMFFVLLPSILISTNQNLVSIQFLIHLSNTFCVVKGSNSLLQLRTLQANLTYSLVSNLESKVQVNLWESGDHNHFPLSAVMCSCPSWADFPAYILNPHVPRPLSHFSD